MEEEHKKLMEENKQLRSQLENNVLSYLRGVHKKHEQTKEKFNAKLQKAKEHIEIQREHIGKHKSRKEDLKEERKEVVKQPNIASGKSLQEQRLAAAGCPRS